MNNFATESNNPDPFTFFIYAAEQSVQEWAVRPAVRYVLRGRLRVECAESAVLEENCRVLYIPSHCFFLQRECSCFP